MKKQLNNFIENIKEDKKISLYDEAATKQGIILQLLSILNWNTFNVDEVSPEYSVKGKRVDFSLRVQKDNKVFIEVKRIGEELSNHQEQLLKYSFQEGVELAVLTNGITWWFYLPLQKGIWEQRRFYTIDIIQQETEEIVSKFIDFLSKENILSGLAIQNAEEVYKSYKKQTILKETLPEAWNKIMSDKDETFIELISETTEKLCGYKPSNEMVSGFISKLKEKLLVSTTPKIPEKEEKSEILTLSQKKYRKFWTGLIEEFKKRNPGITKRKTGKLNWFAIGCFGIGGIHLEWAFNGGYEKKGSWLGNEIHFEKNDREFNHKITEYFENKKDELEEKIGERLFFQREWLKNGTWSRIYAKKNAEVITDEVKEWAIDRMRKFYDTFNPMVEEYIKR